MGLQRDVRLNLNCAARAADGDGAEQWVGSWLMLPSPELWSSSLTNMGSLNIVVVVIDIMVVVIAGEWKLQTELRGGCPVCSQHKEQVSCPPAVLRVGVPSWMPGSAQLLRGQSHRCDVPKTRRLGLGGCS